jgi:hypothetical protein
MKIMKVRVGMVVIFPRGGYLIDFNICTMLNLMSNLFSCKTLMKFHANLVEIHSIWWPLDGFYFLAC